MISNEDAESPLEPVARTRGGIFTIHATRNDESRVTHRIIPDVAVAQAKVLNDAGWRVSISGLGGRQFSPSEFYQLLSSDRIG